MREKTAWEKLPMRDRAKYLALTLLGFSVSDIKDVYNKNSHKFKTGGLNEWGGTDTLSEGPSPLNRAIDGTGLTLPDKVDDAVELYNALLNRPPEEHKIADECNFLGNKKIVKKPRKFYNGGPENIDWYAEIEKDRQLRAAEILESALLTSRTRPYGVYVKDYNGNDPRLSAYNCIATAMDSYGMEHPVTGNLTFIADPLKFGFLPIAVSDTVPGDFVLVIRKGVPVHGMISNNGYLPTVNNMTFNYSSGHSYKNDPNGYRINGKYNISQPLDIKSYRFVGTPLQQEEWRLKTINRLVKPIETSILSLDVKPVLIPLSLFADSGHLFEGGGSYVIKLGDVLGRVALANGTTVQAILKANPGLTADNIKAGLTIILPKDTRRVDFAAYMADTENGGNKGRPLNIKHIEQLQDSLIGRGFGVNQRLAILATAALEMGAAGATSVGVGGNGYLGLDFKRMPKEILEASTTPKGRGDLIHYILEDLTHTYNGYHPLAGNWLRGPKGVGPETTSLADAFNKFWNSGDTAEATKLLNKCYIRPASLKAWDNRAQVAEGMKKHLRANGGYLDNLTGKPFSYSPIPVVRYNNGGHLFDGEGSSLLQTNGVYGAPTWDKRNSQKAYDFSMLDNEVHPLYEGSIPDAWDLTGINLGTDLYDAGMLEEIPVVAKAWGQ